MALFDNRLFQRVICAIHFQQMRQAFSRALKLSPFLFASYAYCATEKRSPLPPSSQPVPLKFKTRAQHLQEMASTAEYDVLVIGGGASGAGVTLDASTRGLKTLVVEQEDFGSGTSSKSTKLIHGGVRYLEQVFQLSMDSIWSRIEKFKLVTEAIQERGVMIRSASYMNQKVPIVIPYSSSLSAIYYYAGSIMYYLIYWASSPPATPRFSFPFFFNRQELHELFPFISDKFQGGVVYEDGSFNDSRMLIATLLTASMRKEQHQSLSSEHVPANILNKTKFVSFLKEGGKIRGAVIQDRLTGKQYEVRAKYVVNCTGTWADSIRQEDDPNKKKRICIVAGSHITYDSRVSNNKFGLCLPSSDGRILLVVPWLGRVIAGTTERKLEEPELNPTISPSERKFIQQSVGEVMEKLSSAALVDLQISRWTGLRPLVMEEEAKSTKDISRTHVIEKSASGLYSLMGGKWTTFRRMGEETVDAIAKDEEQKGNKIGPSKSKDVRLIGSSPSSLGEELKREYGPIGEHLYRNYGSLAAEIVKGDMTPVLGNITRAELEYVVRNEQVTEVEDVLMRRVRVAFLNSREATASLVGLVAELILKEQSKDGKCSASEVQELSRKSMSRLMEYEFD